MHKGQLENKELIVSIFRQVFPYIDFDLTLLKLIFIIAVLLVIHCVSFRDVN